MTLGTDNLNTILIPISFGLFEFLSRPFRADFLRLCFNAGLHPALIFSTLSGLGTDFTNLLVAAQFIGGSLWEALRLKR